MKYDITTHHGQVCQVLEDHFGKERHITGMEIGTLRADLTKTLLWQFQNLTLYTVDPWKYEEGNLFEAGHPAEKIAESKAHALHCLMEFGDRVIVKEMKSDEAFAGLHEYLDFVWIDGDHTLDTVRRDLKNGLAVVKSGGILGGHDYATIFEAINEVLAGREIHRGGDLTWWVYL